MMTHVTPDRTPEPAPARGRTGLGRHPGRGTRTPIRACIASIQAQTHRNLQIIVVDGSSDDATGRS